MRLTDKTSLICQAQSRRPPPTHLTHTIMGHSQIYRGGGESWWGKNYYAACALIPSATDGGVGAAGTMTFSMHEIRNMMDENESNTAACSSV